MFDGKNVYLWACRLSWCQFKRRSKVKHAVYLDTSLNRLRMPMKSIDKDNAQHRFYGSNFPLMRRYSPSNHTIYLHWNVARSFSVSNVEFSFSHPMPCDCDRITLPIRFMFMFMSILPTITNRIHDIGTREYNNTSLLSLIVCLCALIVCWYAIASRLCASISIRESGHSSGLGQVNVWVHQMKWLWYFVSLRHERI